MVKKLNVMNDYELFVGAAAPNTYSLAPPLAVDTHIGRCIAGVVLVMGGFCRWRGKVA